MRKKSFVMKDNKGFSLVELLIVLSISMLIIVALLISYSIISNTNVVKAANRLESVLRTARTSAMSRGASEGVVSLVSEGGLVYAEYGTQRELICGSGLKFQSALVSNPTEDPALADGGGVIVFNTNGKLKTKGETKTTTNYFLISRGTKQYKVVCFIETGSIECGPYTPAGDTPEGGEGGE